MGYGFIFWQTKLCSSFDVSLPFAFLGDSSSLLDFPAFLLSLHLLGFLGFLDAQVLKELLSLLGLPVLLLAVILLELLLDGLLLP